MIGLTSSEVYKSTFNITEENNKFDLFTDKLDQVSFAELKYNAAEVLSLWDISSEDLKLELHGADTIKTYGKLAIELTQTLGYYIILTTYSQSPIRDCESHLTVLVVSDENNIQLILKQNNPHFTTYEISPVIYSNNDISEEFFQEVFKMNLKSESEFDQKLDMIDPIQLSTNVMTLPWWLNWL